MVAIPEVEIKINIIPVNKTAEEIWEISQEIQLAIRQHQELLKSLEKLLKIIFGESFKAETLGAKIKDHD